MTDMVCDNCGRSGIRWMGPLSNLTHTECPHCGGTNCQRIEPDELDLLADSLPDPSEPSAALDRARTPQP